MLTRTKHFSSLALLPVDLLLAPLTVTEESHIMTTKQLPTANKKTCIANFDLTADKVWADHDKKATFRHVQVTCTLAQFLAPSAIHIIKVVSSASGFRLSQPKNGLQRRKATAAFSLVQALYCVFATEHTF